MNQKEMLGELKALLQEDHGREFRHLVCLYRDFLLLDSSKNKDSLHQEITDLLIITKKGEDYFLSKRGKIRRLYCSEVDQSWQPYVVYLPESYDPGSSYGVCLFLHGHIPDINMTDPLEWMGQNKWMKKYNFIVVSVFGRGNRYYTGCGEKDFLDVLSAVRSHYHTDPERTVLSGISMGGYGAWMIGLRYAHLFTGLDIMCGRTDMTHSLSRIFPRTEDPILAQSISPVLYTGNAGKLSISLQHGKKDPVVPVEQSREMAKELKRSGRKIFYKEYPAIGHNVWEKAPLYSKRFARLFSGKKNSWPDGVEHTAFYLRTGKAYWVEITGKKEWPVEAVLQAYIIGKNKICVKTHNTGSFSLDLDHPLLKKRGSIEVGIDGQNLKCMPFPGRDFYLKNGKWEQGKRPGPAGKRRGLEGPWHDFEYSPFVIVQGTRKNKGNLAEQCSAVRDFYNGFFCYPQIITDQKLLNTSVWDGHHVYLTGGPEENFYVKKLWSRLPFQSKKGQFRLKKDHLFGSCGFKACYPDTWNRQRYALLDIRPEKNYKTDPLEKTLIPDYLVYKMKENRVSVLEQGFFSSFWAIENS